MKEEKEEMSVLDLICLEKALSLKARTGFEDNFLIDRLSAVKNFGFNTMMSQKQRQILYDLADRYDSAYIFQRKEK